jgi:Zn ribbon nucleic-acid-binding protein
MHGDSAIRPAQQLADLEAGRSDPTFGGHSATAADPRFDGHARCPVCGHQLDFIPWIGTSPSHRTCPSCGTRFGFHDMLSRGDPKLLVVEQERLRGRWLEHGARWSSTTIPPPPHWDPQRQLRNLDVP